MIVTTPQATAQKVARRAAEMADKVNLEIARRRSRTCPASPRRRGERFAIFGEGGGQALADELDVPLLGKVPLTMPLREQADAGVPLVVTDPDDPAAQAIRQAARGLIAMSPDRAAGAAGARPRRPRPAGRHVPADGLADFAQPVTPRRRRYGLGVVGAGAVESKITVSRAA